MQELPKEWLIGPTTVREYDARILDAIDDLPESLRRKAEAHVAKVEAKLQPGDELWEWRYDHGPFASGGGLPIIRGGVVGDWWREWVS